MQDRSFYAFSVAQAVTAAVLLWVVFSRPRPWDLQLGIGAALVTAGIAGIAAARYQLGKSFSIKAEARQLVTRGVYSKIRNPIYVFGVLMVTGFLLVLHRPALWLILPVVIVGQTIRARREARVLEAAFGENYRQYRRKTWF